MQFPKELQLNVPVDLIHPRPSLNEVQFPKELQRVGIVAGAAAVVASMKCSSRRNCNRSTRLAECAGARCLNEVQFPKELQHGSSHITVLDPKPQ